MNQLPIEIKKMIFSYLSIKDALRLKCVCKQWNEIIDTLRYKELSIIRQNAFKRNSWRIYRYEPVRTNQVIELKDDRYLLSLSSKSCFKHVLKLSTLFTNVNSFYLLKFYEQFERLEELTIDSNNSFSDSIRQDELRSKIVLKLSELTKLTVMTNHFKFNLKTPKLSELICRTFLVEFEFQFPERLRYLDAHSVYDYSFPKLINLQVLVIRHELNFSFSKFFQQTPGLREIHLCFNCDVDKYLRSKDEHQQFDVFVHGFNNEPFYRTFSKRLFLKELLEKQPNLLIQHLPFLSPRIYCEFEMNFSELERLDKEQLENLVEKFGDKEVKVVFLDRKLKNVDCLLDFLKATRPFCLKIKNNKYDQRLLDELPSLEFIKEFHLNAKKVHDFRQLNFLFKMSNLEVIKLKNNSFSISFVIDAFEKMHSLREIGFFENPFSMLKNYRAFFLSNFTESSVSVCIPGAGRRKKEFSSKHQLLDFLIDLDKKAVCVSEIYEIFL